MKPEALPGERAQSGFGAAGAGGILERVHAGEGVGHPIAGDVCHRELPDDPDALADRGENVVRVIDSGGEAVLALRLRGSAWILAMRALVDDRMHSEEIEVRVRQRTHAPVRAVRAD